MGSRLRIPRLLIWAAGLTGCLAVGAACDTTAKISFPNRTFNAAHSSGFIAPQGQCQSFGPDNGGTAKLRFVMVDDDDTPILPGEGLEDGEVQMSADSVELSSNRLFSAPDLTCGGGGPGSLRAPGAYPSSHDAGGLSDVSDAGDTNGGMSQDTGSTTDTGGMTDTGGDGNGNGMKTDDTYTGEFLQYDGSCSGPYNCRSAKEEAGRRCQASTQIQVEGVSHVADTKNDQLFGLVVENSRTMGGWYPEETQQWYYDENADGDSDTQVPASPRRVIATDSDRRRMSVVSTLSANWQSVLEDAEAQNRETRFGLWAIDGERPPATSYVTENGGPDSGFTNNPQIVTSAITEFRGQEVDGSMIGNVYETMHSVIENNFSQNQFAEHQKTMVVMVDGPPERSRPNDRSGNIGVGDIIEKAQNQNIRIFIVHLDPALKVRADGTNKKLLYDNPTYWEGQQNSCQGGGCKNFETCRKVHGYNENQNRVPVTINGNGNTWCMPQRRSDGRLGPIREYNRIACATKGGYAYIKSVADLGGATEWLPYTMDGLWEAEVTIGNASVQQYTDSTESIRVQSTVNVTAASSEQTIDLSQVGGSRGEDPGSGDRRSVLFTGN